MAPLPSLPSDVLFMIAGELAQQQDFSTLFACSVSGSQWAKAGAISHLYQICHLSPITNETQDSHSPGEPVERDTAYHKWAILWRSLILSSYGETLLPYSQYIRVLDLRNLNDLLDDSVGFRGKVASYFFSGRLAHLGQMLMAANPKAVRSGRNSKLDLPRVILAVGDILTASAHKIEVVTEPVIIGKSLLHEGLPRWTESLQGLRFLQLGDGSALLADEDQDRLIEACPLLEQLEIFHWRNEPRSDATLARFFSKLRPNTLTLFQNQSDCGIGEAACAALSKHSESLTSLHLAVGIPAIQALRNLRPITKLSSLTLENLALRSGTESLQVGLQADLMEWFESLHQLRRLVLLDFVAAPALLTPALRKSSFKLQHLEIWGHLNHGCFYLMHMHDDFHLALGAQTELQTLLLAGDSRGCNSEQLDSLCASISSLSNLRKLDLSRSSDQFTDDHLASLCGLQDLEWLMVEGTYATEVPLNQLAKLKKIKTLTLAGFTGFRFESYKMFVASLGEENRGLAFDVLNPYWDGSMTPAQQEEIASDIKAKVGGAFFYQAKDPEEAGQYGSDTDSD